MKAKEDNIKEMQAEIDRQKRAKEETARREKMAIHQDKTVEFVKQAQEEHDIKTKKAFFEA